MLQAVIAQHHVESRMVRAQQRERLVAPATGRHRQTGRSRQQHRFVAVRVRVGAAADQAGIGAARAIAAGEHAHAQPARRERTGQRDRQGRLACAARHQVADHDDGRAVARCQAPDAGAAPAGDDAGQ
ncbi:MAG TPA: hypothetical protein PK929_11155, partial [Quisquiliibacterium sp.]|nr:hypothetical protein [Quisquiliibacterium sp.]